MSYQPQQSGQWGQPPYSPYPPPFQQPPAPPKKRGGRTCLIVTGIIGAIILVVIIGAVLGTMARTPATTTTTTTTSTAVATTSGNTKAATPTPKPAFMTFGDGTYQVGKDIQPGTYRTRVGSSGCYYARLKGFGGAVGDIIANDNTDAPAIVTIKPTDKGFESQNCGTWTSDLSRITASKTSFGDGMYFIRRDITPGTYRNSGGDSCYEARLSGFSGDLSEIISNNNVSGSTIVTIAATDKGFLTRGCGTWTRQ